MAIKDDKLRDIGLLVLRVGLGSVLFYYGLQKGFGAFGGSGFQRTLEHFHTMVGAPTWLGALAIVSELGGSIAVILGLFTRVAAFGMMSTMAVAAYSGATRLGVMNGLWNGDPTSPPPVMYPMALMFMALALVLTGAGSLSLDAKVFKRSKKG